MSVLPMTPSRPDELPAVGLHDSDELPHLHPGMIVAVQALFDKMADIGMTGSGA
jgi:hypothetical protein